MSAETIDEFRDRARRWLKQHLPPAPAETGGERDWDRARELQRILYDGGFAGICFPAEYGGLGLSPEYQKAFTEESVDYEMPLALNMPTFSICAPTILDMGTEEQKRQHLGAVIRGDEVLVQFLSEPRGGSDLAGVTTRAERDGDNWILNGSKIWSSGAYGADYGLCLARTDWDAPKHGGLTMFLVPVHATGVTIQRIEQVNGSTEFCQEFFDNVVLPADAVLGEVNDGWRTANRQLFHERTAVGGGSPYFSGRAKGQARREYDHAGIARQAGRLDDPRVREDIGEAYAMRMVDEHLIARVSRAVATGALPESATAMIRLLHAENGWLQLDLALRIAGASAVTGGPGGERALGDIGLEYLSRQLTSLGGGTTEMARNVISERVLGMPREYAADRDVPFNQVRQGS